MKTRIGIKAVSLILPVCYAIFAGQVNNLFSDHRAMRVDDILTVMIVESAKAGSESKTNTSKQNSMGLNGGGGAGALGFIPSFGVSGSNKVDYDGKGGLHARGVLLQLFRHEL